jgi:HK97 family phage major capsid protein
MIIMIPVSSLRKGTELARWVSAVGQAGKNNRNAIEIAERWRDSPGVALQIRNEAESAGSTTNSAALVQYRPAQEFLEFERAASIVGRLRATMSPAMFLTQLAREIAGAVSNWIAEGSVKPLSAFEFDTLAIPPYKVATTVVVSKELLQFSKPSMQTILGRSLPRANAAFLDRQFLDPTVALVVSEHPAAITNGAAEQVSSGGSAAQILSDLQAMIAALGSFESPFFIMRPTTAAYIASTSPTLFPLLRATPDGGILCGCPVLNSMNSPQQITLLDAADIQYADDDQVSLDVAQHADILMDDGVREATTTVVSLFQRNLTAVRSERTVSWLRSHSDSVVFMTTAY